MNSIFDKGHFISSDLFLFFMFEHFRALWYHELLVVKWCWESFAIVPLGCAKVWLIRNEPTNSSLTSLSWSLWIISTFHLSWSWRYFQIVIFRRALFGLLRIFPCMNIIHRVFIARSCKMSLFPVTLACKLTILATQALKPIWFLRKIWVLWLLRFCTLSS